MSDDRNQRSVKPMISRRGLFSIAGLISTVAALRGSARPETLIRSAFEPSSSKKCAGHVLDPSIVRVESISALRSLTSLVDGQIIDVTGYYSGGILHVSGGGRFIWHASSVEEPNEGTVIAKKLGGGGRFHRIRDGVEIMASWFGVAANNLHDDTSNWQEAIDFAAKAIHGAAGATVRGFTGTSLISRPIVQPNRVAIAGPNGRGLKIKAARGFSGTELLHSHNDTSSMFGARVCDVEFDGAGLVDQCILTDAWQESSGPERVVCIGATKRGIWIRHGYGGAAFLRVRDCEVFVDSPIAEAGIRVSKISLNGSFIFNPEGVTIAGGQKNILPVGILLENDGILGRVLHFENVEDSIRAEGMGAVTLEHVTGSSNRVTNLLRLTKSFVGEVHCRNLIPNGAIGLTVADDALGHSVRANEGVLPRYEKPAASFKAIAPRLLKRAPRLSSGTNLAFEIVAYDSRHNYDMHTGIFTAPKTGKYLFECFLKLNLRPFPQQIRVWLSTTQGEYHSCGDYSSASNSEFATLRGAFLASMTRGDKARIVATGDSLEEALSAMEVHESYFSGALVEYSRSSDPLIISSCKYPAS